MGEPDNAGFELERPSQAFGRAGSGARRRVMRSLALVALLLAVTLSVALGAAWLTTPRLENFLPAQTSVAGETDLKWWWDATSDFRRMPDVQKALAQVDKQSHISLESQVIPWIGQVGGGVVSFNGEKTPSFVICLQVRNWLAFGRVLARAQNEATAEAGAKWQPATYDGYHIERATIYDDPKKKKGPTLIETAMVHGWLIVGVQPGALEAALDTYVGKRASIASLPEWKKAQSLLPGRRVSWLSMNAAALADQTGSDKLPAVSEAEKEFVAIAFSDTGNGFRWDGVVIPQTASARSALARNAGQTHVTPADLAYVPNDANVTFLTSSGKDWIQGVNSYLKTAIDSNLKKQAEIADFQKKYRKYNGQVMHYVAPYTGPAGASFVFRSDTRCGAVAFAITAQPGQGLPAYNNLAKLDIAPYPKWVPKFKEHKFKEGIYGFQPVEALDGTKLSVATAPAWLNDPTGHPHLHFPDAPRGVDFLVMGNFDFLQAAKNASDAFAPSNLDARRTIEAFRLNNAQWSYWSATSPSGQYEQVCGEVDGWPWRQAERDLVTVILRNEAKGKAAKSVHATHV